MHLRVRQHMDQLPSFGDKSTILKGWRRYGRPVLVLALNPMPSIMCSGGRSMMLVQRGWCRMLVFNNFTEPSITCGFAVIPRFSLVGGIRVAGLDVAADSAFHSGEDSVQARNRLGLGEIPFFRNLSIAVAPDTHESTPGPDFNLPASGDKPSVGEADFG